MRLSIILAALAAMTLSTTPLAAEGHEVHEGKCPKNGEMRAKLVERFDANKDGMLDESERAAAKAACQEKKGEMAAKILAKHPELDTNGDGKLDKEEAEAGRAARQAKFKEKHPEAFAKIDTNGDGTIDHSERKAARKHCGEGRGEHGKGRGEHGDKRDDK